MKNKPILGDTIARGKTISAGTIPKEGKVPVLPRKDYSTKFTFSLQFFRQINHFQIGGLNNSWYVSLLDRLHELSKKNWQEFEKSVLEKQNLRYHEINWEGRNVPISREDLNWLDYDYRTNIEEYPIVQFHISKALGRVVGFWDEARVFQIILLDPKHNIQPSKFNDYKVDDTYFLSCDYSSLLVDIKNVQKKIKPGCICKTCLEIKKMPTRTNNTNLIIAHLDDSYIQKLKEVDLPIEEVLETGLLQFP